MIEINNFTSFKIDKKFFVKVAKNVLKRENRKKEKISIAFIDSKEIKKLNKKYRHINKPTDVLSFGAVNGFENQFLEIILSPEVIKEKTGLKGKFLKKEIASMLIHGLLHVLGYDHGKSSKKDEIMEKKEREYLALL